MRTAALTLTVLSLVLPSIEGQTVDTDEKETLSVEVWTIDDEITHAGSDPRERLLAEAQYFLSGIIYGWDFLYIPAHRARGVERTFQLTPRARIAWGDESLHVSVFQRKGNTLRALVGWDLSQADRTRLRGWRESTLPPVTGSAYHALSGGLEGKLTAIDDAISDAIRAHLQSHYVTPPREVNGSAALRSSPRIYIDEGRYIATIEVYLDITEVLLYTVF